MAEELTHQQRSLGFLAMKAWGYSQFPSIRRASADWQLIADIAAASYNTLDADREESAAKDERIRRLKWLVGEKERVLRKQAGYRHTREGHGGRLELCGDDRCLEARTALGWNESNCTGPMRESEADAPKEGE